MKTLFDKEYAPEGERRFRLKVDDYEGGIAFSIGRTKGPDQAQRMRLTKSEAKALCSALLETTSP